MHKAKMSRYDFSSEKGCNDLAMTILRYTRAQRVTRPVLFAREILNLENCKDKVYGLPFGIVHNIAKSDRYEFSVDEMAWINNWAFHWRYKHAIWWDLPAHRKLEGAIAVVRAWY